MKPLYVNRSIFTVIRLALLIAIMGQTPCIETLAVEDIISKTSQPAFIEAAKAPEYGFGGSFGFFKPFGDLSSFNNIYGGAGFMYEGKFFQRFKNGIGWEARIGYFKKSGDLVTGPPAGGQLFRWENPWWTF